MLEASDSWPIGGIVPEIFPLRGIRYAPSVVERLERVVTPPYDVISPDAQRGFYRKSPHNFIRVVYGHTRAEDRPGRDRYSRAAGTFQAWIRQGILRMDRLPACYPYRQRFTCHGRSHDRWGVIALIRLGEPTLFPHEDTHAGPKQDRLQLMRAVEANLSPIFGLVEDEGGTYREVLQQQTKRPPMAAVQFEDVQHELWRVSMPLAIRRLQRTLEGRALLLADGHHRYESAMTYRDSLRRHAGSFGTDHPSNFMLIYVAAFDTHDPGILATHRVFSGLPGWSPEQLRGLPVTIQKFPDQESLRAVVEGLGTSAPPALACYTRRTGWWLVSLAQRHPEIGLDVELLHRLIVPQAFPTTPTITYTHEWDEALRQADADAEAVAWFLRPLAMAQILRGVQSGRRLPQKSTYFVPNPLSGLVIHRLRRPGPIPAQRYSDAASFTPARGAA